MLLDHNNHIMFLKEHCTMSYLESTKLMNMSEADGLNISDKVVAQLYKFTLDKYNNVDFGDIPNSKGDIKKFSYYENILAGIELLRSLEAQSNEGKIEQIDTVEDSLKNLEKYSREFTMAYKIDNTLCKMMYEVITMGIVRALTYMIGNAVTYVKDPTVKSFKSLFNGKEEDVLIRNLRQFNKAVQQGHVDKILSSVIAAKNFGGIGTGATIALIIGILTIIVPLLRELVYIYYNSKMQIREFFKFQSETLKQNLYSLKFSNNFDPKVIKKQEEAVKNLDNIANKFNIDSEVSVKKAENMIKNEKINVNSFDKSENLDDMGIL